jgi:hypothetical protein
MIAFYGQVGIAERNLTNGLVAGHSFHGLKRLRFGTATCSPKTLQFTPENVQLMPMENIIRQSQRADHFLV